MSVDVNDGVVSCPPSQTKKECDVLRKSLSEAAEARQSSEVECKKLQKEVSRVKELREVSPPPPIHPHPLVSCCVLCMICGT